MIAIRKYYADTDPPSGGSAPAAAPDPPVPAVSGGPMPVPAAPAAPGGGGGAAPAPIAPKGYAVTTPQQRTEWNGFLDYLDKQGVAGKPDLDKPGAGLKYFQDYKKANPNISLTPEHIQNIQYEQYQLRKGEQFGTLNKMQLDHLRSGLASNYLNKPLSDVNGQINSATSKLYYPAGKSYGTDIEHYDTALGQAVPAVAPSAATPGAPAGASAAPNVAPATEVPPSGGDLPQTYANHDTALKRTNQLAAIPGNEWLHGRGDALINANYVPEWTDDTKSLRDSAKDAATKVGLDPAFFWGSAAEEGATGLISNKKGGITTDPKIDLDGKYRVSGFTNFGLDNFHTNFKEMVSRGYLPKDFDYQKSTHVNEHGVTVQSGDFKTIQDALTAKAAYVRMEQDNLDDWAKTDGGGVKLSPAARQFFTVVAYNGGPGTAHKMINYYKKNGLLDGDKFFQQPPPESVDPGHSFDKVIPRWRMGQLLKKENIL